MLEQAPRGPLVAVRALIRRCLVIWSNHAFRGDYLVVDPEPDERSSISLRVEADERRALARLQLRDVDWLIAALGAARANLAALAESEAGQPTTPS